MHDFNLNPVVFWTLEYSQLTQAIILAFHKLQVDLFLYKALGPVITFLILSAVIIPSSIILLRLTKKEFSYKIKTKKELED